MKGKSTITLKTFALYPIKLCIDTIKNSLNSKILHCHFNLTTYADDDLVIIQDLLGHKQIRTTQRYRKVSTLKDQRDYHRAIERVMAQHSLNKTA